MNIWSLGSYCKTNISDPLCQCIEPPSSIINIAQVTGQPYYCWFKPCFTNGVYKTLAIQQAQLACQATECTISISDISISGGRINISNMCGSLASRLVSSQINVDLTPYEWSFKLPIVNNIIGLSTLAIIMSIYMFTTAGDTRSL
jgi:hypothetical protein